MPLKHRKPRNLIHADAVADHRGVLASPAAILLEGNTIIAVGTPEEIGSIQDVPLTQIHGTVTPSFVNAHTHFDLSGVGTVPATDSFVAWVENVVLPIRRNDQSIQEHVEKGIELSLAGGSRIVGDIAGTILAAEIVESSELISVSYVELLGLGVRQQAAIEKMQSTPAAFGVSPHAPYSCGKELYKACFESGRKIATHLAETPEELESVRDHRGDLVDFATRIGAWDETVEPWNEHPVDAVLHIAGESKCTAAHLNYIEDRHLPMLASSNMTVVYCPRASAYFGHEGHRWKEMIDAGVQVALGTDSLLCLDMPDRISVLDEMRLLYSRDDGDPRTLMAMATINGAVGLGMDPTLVTLEHGETAGLLAFDGIGTNPLIEILESRRMPRWVF